MRWFSRNNLENIPKLPTIDEISTEVPSVSEYLDAFRLPEAFKQAESDTLPVIDIKGNIIGIVSEYDLAKVLPEWSFEEESYRYNITVADIMTRNVWTEPEHTNIRKLLSSVHQMHTRVIPIINREGRYTGKVITRTALVSFLTKMVKPRSIGGLATPLGVYLTDGRHQAGPGNLGLITTGLAFGVMILFIDVLTSYIFNFITAPRIIVILVQLALFILILRLTPLVKFHAAEHQTIHAIEKGLPLSIDTVRMQPRAHKRCGTNIMVLLVGIQLVLILSYELMVTRGLFAQFIFLIIGFLFVLSNWRKVGMWLQNYLTTKEAANSQIENAIKAGEEILKKHKEDINPTSPSIWEKIWNMGIVQILISFMLVLWIFNNILSLL